MIHLNLIKGDIHMEYSCRQCAVECVGGVICKNFRLPIDIFEIL